MKTKLLALICVAAMLISVLAGCTPAENENGGTECSHPLSETWSSDNKNHWRPTTCEHSEYRSTPEAHADADEDGKCDTCAYEMGHTHTYDSAWSSDGTSHWKAATCTHTEEKSQISLHLDDNTDGVCDVCTHHVHVVDSSGYCTICDEKVNDIEAPGNEESTDNGDTDYDASEGGGDTEGESEPEPEPEPKPETDADTLKTVLAAIMDRSPKKVLNGKVDYGVVIRSADGNLENGDTVEYVIHTDGTYTKRTETDAAGKTVLTEVWMELLDAANEIVGAISVTTVDGKVTYAEPVSVGVDNLAGYYFAVSTLASEYGAEAVLKALYELALTDTASDFTVVRDKEGRTFTFSYNILIINTDTAEGEDDGVDYYEVEVIFGYSEDYILTSMKIVCDCYTNSLADEAERDYVYDQATKTITMKDGARADTYTFSVTQSAGTRTAIVMESAEKYVPTDVTIYEDEAHTTEASSVTVLLGTDPDYIPVFYVGCPEGTFISFVKNAAEISVDQVGLTASLVGETIQFYPALAGTYVITLAYGNVSKSVTVVVEDVELEGDQTIEVTLTDTYTWVDICTFTAPESGTYTFYLPYGVGAWDQEAHDDFSGAPYVDFQGQADGAGGSFSVDIAKGKSYSFYVSAMTKGTYTIGYDFEAKEVIEEEDKEDEELVLPLQIGNTGIEKKDARYSLTVDEAGTLTLRKGAVINGTVDVTYSVNGAEAITLATSSEVILSLEAGDQLLVVVVATGYSSLTVLWQSDSASEEEDREEIGSGDGTEGSPFVITIPVASLEVEGDASGMLWYSFTVTEAGTLTVTYSGANSWVRIWNANNAQDSNQGHNKESYAFQLKENSTYRLGLGVWDAEEGVTATLTFTPATEA